jgi:signal transduction histidine kinase
MAGIMIVAPVLISWGVREPPRRSRRRVLEASLLALLLAFTGAAVFGPLLPADGRKYAFAFMSVPPLLWAAFRFGPRETASSGFVLSLLALWGTLSGFGPFVREDPNESLLMLQSFISSTCLMAALFAAVVAESRRRAAAPLRQDLARIGRVSALGELSASLAHELSQPLAAIRSNRAGGAASARARRRIDELVRILADIVEDDERAAP